MKLKNTSKKAEPNEYTKYITNALLKRWRFSAVVASFVAQTKLLNVEPG